MDKWKELRCTATKIWDIHEKLIEIITTSIFYLEFKGSNENDMATHAVCFDFYHCRQLSTMARYT